MASRTPPVLAICFVTQGPLTSAEASDKTRRYIAQKRATVEAALRRRFEHAKGELPSDASAEDLAKFYAVMIQGIALQAPYLRRQVLDIMIALKTCTGNSKYLLPSRYDADAPMSRATFNRVTYSVVELAKKEGLPLEPFTVHDLRRTGSTLLNDWASTAIGSRSALRTRTAARHAASTTRPNTRCSAAI